MAAEIFPFKFYDDLRGRWVKARYKATREEIAARYSKWEITGPGWTPPSLGGTASQLADPARATGTAEAMALALQPYQAHYLEVVDGRPTKVLLTVRKAGTR